MSDLDNGAIINFTNTGTIRQGTETFGSGNTYWGIVQAYDSTDEINFNNSGTMQSSRRIFMLDGTTNFTITNSGTIKQGGGHTTIPTKNILKIKKIKL